MYVKKEWVELNWIKNAKTCTERSKMFSLHQCRMCMESIHVAGDLETVYMQIKNHLDCMSTLCAQGNNFMKEQRN